MPPLKIAIVGCGIAGMAAGIFLARSGHRVTLFERFAAPQPVGAGLLLQPSGIAVLRELELLDKVQASGAVVTGLEGVNHRQRKVLSLRYRDLHPDYFGIGIHRARLFDVLHQTLINTGIEWRLGAEVSRIEQTDTAAFVQTSKEKAGPYDLVVAADGSHSSLRRTHEHNGRTRPYPWAALWCMVPDREHRFTDTLQQAYRLGRQMVGVLPAGCNDEGTPEVTLFWSLRGDGYDAWHDVGLPAWKAEVQALLPATESLLDYFHSPEQLTFSRYWDVRPKSWADRRLVYIGDAAHGTSPQLGQGANLALWDAKVLSECLDESALPQALRAYTAKRQAAVRYYQWASRWLTPCFQSDNRLIPLLRDGFMHPVARLPGIRRYALETLCGLRGGFIASLKL